MRVLAVLLLASVLVPYTSCAEESAHEPSSPSGAPALTSMVPPQASVGDAITLKGSGFSARNTGVKIGSGYVNNVTPTDDTTLTFKLPSALSACPPGTEVCVALAIPVTPGSYQVSVVTAEGTSNALTLQVAAR
jgi:hypothetical protein